MSILDLESLEPDLTTLIYEEKKKNLILWSLSTLTTFVTHIQTNGHDNSMTDPSQRAESVKSARFVSVLIMHGY